MIPQKLMMADANVGGGPAEQTVSCDNAAASGSVFNFVEYTGNGGTTIIDNVGFQPDMVWVLKNASSSKRCVFMSNIGATKFFDMNSTPGLTTDAESLKTFDSDGVTFGNSLQGNENGIEYVVLFFQEVSGDFSLFTYTGNGSTKQNIAHGLGATPDMYIVKEDGTENWIVYHKDLNDSVNPEDELVRLDITTTEVNSTTVWDSTAPTATNIRVGDNTESNTSGQTYWGMAFKSDGSASGQIFLGKYTGDGNDSGPSINIGWAADVFMTRRVSASGTARQFHKFRGSGNPVQHRWDLSSSGAEGTSSSYEIDFNATNVQIRATAQQINGDTRKFMVWALRLKT